MAKKKTNVETDSNGKISKVNITLNTGKNCRRCGASKDIEKYIECFDEYCDTRILLDDLYF